MRRSAFLCVGRRRPVHQSLFLLLLMGLSVIVGKSLWWLAEETNLALKPPPPLDHNLHHLRRSRSLKDYIDNTQLLIQPSSTACEGAEEVPLVVMVSSSPSNLDQRDAIRLTWAKHQPTFFVLGLDGTDGNDQLSDTYIEAKEFGDMVVFDFQDHYANLTLKTGLMLHWALRRCPHAGALLKTDDDVLVNPWVLREVLSTNKDKQLIGYRINNSGVHRDEYTKWNLPRWLYQQDFIPEYLSGTGYIINGDYIQRIYQAAHNVPLINLEDVYFTYNVAKAALGLTLTHNRQLSPYRPLFNLGCAYWSMASCHSLSPDEIVAAWSKVIKLAGQFEKGDEVCRFRGFLSSDWLLY